MNGAQYNNVIKWTLCFGSLKKDSDSQTVARAIFKNAGVSYPLGNNSEVMRVLKKRRFLGWTAVSAEDAQRFADLGVAAMGICEEKTVVVSPDEKLGVLSNLPELLKAANPYVMHAADISPDEREKMRFYAYSYGHKLNDK